MLADRHQDPKLARVIRGGIAVLEDELRNAFGMHAAGRAVIIAALGIGALGVILDDLAAQLTAIKPHLAGWWETKRRDLARDSARSRGQDDQPSN